jgi:hypothetical protein
MSQNDIRAVENPISAIFDLAEDVNKEIPRIRKLVMYATIFIGIWLIVCFILLFSTIFKNLFLGLGLLALFIIGILALAMLRNLNDFIKYYALRHAAIVRVRNDDPVIFAPKGETSVLRLLEFIRLRNPNMSNAILNRDYQVPAILKGDSGVFYNFDGYLTSRASWLWGFMGLGYPGYQLFIKAFSAPPRPEDLLSLKKAVEDISIRTKIPPSRVIALWSRKADQDLSEESYHLLTGTTLVFHHRGKRFASSLELIIENEDHSYEFIPYVADGPYFSAPRAQ